MLLVFLGFTEFFGLESLEKLNPSNLSGEKFVGTETKTVKIFSQEEINKASDEKRSDYCKIHGIASNSCATEYFINLCASKWGTSVDKILVNVKERSCKKLE